MRVPPRLTRWPLLLCSVGPAIGTPGTDQVPLAIDAPERGLPFIANKNHTLPKLINALDVLQSSYFEVWQGVWPTSIDWTSAVIGTYLSSSLITVSSSFDSLSSFKLSENLVNRYFAQLVGSYFGQDAFGLRQEAYDDMLWVVLGWLESVKFITAHSSLHYGASESGNWYGEEYVPAFAHRARIFWDLASKGWDTSLCDGGMIWSPYLLPYKNAITNELWIAASISMYLYFPGDDNSSPFWSSASATTRSIPRAISRDPKYLAAAIEAYKWLKSSNMTDAKGLYVDGYHISGLSGDERFKNGTKWKKCDERNEMVYTYNQGVLLSGQRGLYEATGAKSYLEDGHQLIADAIAATGWNWKLNTAPKYDRQPGLGKWHGLGRNGILEEFCDAGASCSQDSQTFKGIFFHHLTIFCSALPERLAVPDGTFVGKDLSEDQKFHDAECRKYGAWIGHNAEAALATVDATGRFGMWWGAPENGTHFHGETELIDQAVDYRNRGVPAKWSRTAESLDIDRLENRDFGIASKVEVMDLNDRGRGRSVETQGGGVAVLRALWELVDTRSPS
jgi:hypothetical protein